MRIILLYFFLALSCIGISQNPHAKCFTDVRLAQNLSKQGINFTSYQQIIKHQQLKAQNLMISPRSSYTLSVVVHIVYQDESQNISALEIQKQIDILNQDFSATNPNLIATNPSFRGMESNTKIQFCLATIDPDGAPSSGITRTQTNIEDIGWTQEGDRLRIHYDELGGKTGWDPQKYINIWVCAFSGGVLGYGTYPGTATYPEEDGIVINSEYFNHAYPFKEADIAPKTLTHEMGHYLNVQHPWGLFEGDCDEDDGIEDTPRQSTIYFGCPEITPLTCFSGDLFNSFMNYCDDRCLTLFTDGQGEHMRQSIQVLRPGLIAQASCKESPGIPNLKDVSIYFDIETKRLTITNLNQQEMDLSVDIFASDGKLVFTDKISNRYIFQKILSIDPGVYICRLRLQDEFKIFKFNNINHN